MPIQNKFKRVEIKFILNDGQTEAVKRAFLGKMRADEYEKREFATFITTRRISDLSENR